MHGMLLLSSAADCWRGACRWLEMHRNGQRAEAALALQRPIARTVAIKKT